jgi:kinesin family protein 3/17
MENIQVVARVRPSFDYEEGGADVLTVESGETVVVSGRRPVRQTFDRAFGNDAKQNEVYSFLRPMVASALDGYHSTVFAYGLTGTGKTFTMLGDGDADGSAISFDGPRDCWGVIPRAVRDIFTFAAASSGQKTCKVWISYLEVYNEKIFDLLHAGAGEAEELDIREDKQRGVFVAGASEVLAASREDVFEMLRRGARARSIAATDLNARSSRSHTIFRATIEQTDCAPAPPGDVAGAAPEGEGGERAASPQPKLVTRSKLNLVDLAGSEKWHAHQMSRMSGKRVSEMTAINQSLSALGNCIRALSQSGRSHIPFRDSKLTRLLADSLGGNTRTAFIVTLSPTLEAMDESRRSLQFAARAKRVAVYAKVNELVDDASQVSVLLYTVTFNANIAHSLTRSP